MNSIKLGKWPVFAQDEIDAATNVLSSGQVNYWTGSQGKAFERELASRFMTRHAIALANGTVALEVALRALDIGNGDEVIVTPRSYFASTGAVMAVGATPVFADVDGDSQNLTSETIRACLTPKTRAVLPVHLAGWPCDMTGISELAAEHGVLVIEDCAQAHGARWRDQTVGSFGEASTFSFCQDKIVTTAGEGGALLTNCQDVFECAWSLKEDGKNCKQAQAKTNGGSFRYLRERLGSNYRMSEVQAAVGRRQLKKLESWLRIRRHYASLYDEAFSRIEALRVVRPPEEAFHAYYQYYVFVRPSVLSERLDRDQVVARLIARGVPCSAGACGEIYREKPVMAAGHAPERPLAVAAELAATSLALPVHPGLSESQIEWIIKQVAAQVQPG